MRLHTPSRPATTGPSCSGPTKPPSGWERHHERAAVTRQVLAQLDAAVGADLPWSAPAAAVFDGPDDLLRALHDIWSRRLLARVDNALELAGALDVDVVVEAWRRQRDAMPGLRSLLDHHVDHPALARGQLVEHRMLAVAAGLAALDDAWDRSARVGRELVARARSA